MSLALSLNLSSKELLVFLRLRIPAIGQRHPKSTLRISKLSLLTFALAAISQSFSKVAGRISLKTLFSSLGSRRLMHLN